MDTSKLPVYRHRYRLKAHWLVQVGGMSVGFGFNVVGALLQVMRYRTAFVVLVDTQAAYDQITTYLDNNDILYLSEIEADISAITIYQQSRN